MSTALTMEKSPLVTVQAGGRTFHLLGTAHVSSESVREVREALDTHNPDHLCVELDAGRLGSLRDPEAWEKLDLGKIIREGKGFLMMANLVLAGFQKRAGSQLGSKPGAEMLAAIDAADERHLPYSLIDRDVAVTLRRAWARTGFWGRNKLLAALLGSAFDRTPMKKEEVENLKRQTGLDQMMDELAKELPKTKEVLIDERDAILALGTWEAPGNTVLSVVGAGHVPGMVRHLNAMAQGAEIPDRGELNRVPSPGWMGKILPWIVPAVIVGFLGYSLYTQGWEQFLSMLGSFSLYTGAGAAIGSLLALAHPITIVAGFLAAPIAALHPLIGVGMFTGLTEIWLRKPRVGDFQHLQDDSSSLKGFYRNRITRTLLVVLLSSFGVIAGTVVTGTSFLSFLFR